MLLRRISRCKISIYSKFHIVTAWSVHIQLCSLSSILSRTCVFVCKESLYSSRSQFYVMGRTSKRSREEIASKIELHRLNGNVLTYIWHNYLCSMYLTEDIFLLSLLMIAKKRAVELLKNCLDNHLLTEEHTADLITRKFFLWIYVTET